MYQKFKEYITISSREYRGMFVFVIIIFLIYISPYVYEQLTFQPLKVSIQVLEPKIENIERFNQIEKKTYKYQKTYKEKKEIQLFNFNPNNLPLEDWMKFGLSKKQANSIKNYEAKGGKFRTKSDVQKMYAIKPQLYQQLEPYIQIPENENVKHDLKKQNSNPVYQKTIEPKIVVDINQADSALFTEIKGIGPSFAIRILKYRERLGGFVALEQLREVYGIDSLKYEQIKSQIKIEILSIKQIEINKCTFDQLKNFPYLSYKQSNVIINYRKQHGNYKSASDLNKIAILNPEIVQKIAPYLKF